MTARFSAHDEQGTCDLPLLCTQMGSHIRHARIAKGKPEARGLCVKGLQQHIGGFGSTIVRVQLSSINVP